VVSAFVVFCSCDWLLAYVSLKKKCLFAVSGLFCLDKCDWSLLF
jgi:hypothetical protein